MEDKETCLIRLACKGDRNAFWNLVEPCQRIALLVATTILGNVADGEEATQEAILKALANIQKFRGDAKFSTWLIKITINEARQRLRRDRRHLHRSLNEFQSDDGDEYVPQNFTDWCEIPSEALLHKELRDALKRALDSLPPHYREVLILRDVQHLSIREVAHVLGISSANVKTRLRRARLQMRDFLAPGINGSWALGSSDFKKGLAARDH